VSEPAGVWAGREVEVVYDPAAHQVVMFRSDAGDKARVVLAGEGFRRLAVDDRQEMWVRERTAQVDAEAEPLATVHSLTLRRVVGTQGHSL